MNLKKIGLTTLSAAALLFSCSNSNTSISREDAQKFINEHYSESVTQKTPTKLNAEIKGNDYGDEEVKEMILASVSEVCGSYGITLDENLYFKGDIAQDKIQPTFNITKNTPLPQDGNSTTYTYFLNGDELTQKSVNSGNEAGVDATMINEITYNKDGYPIRQYTDGYMHSIEDNQQASIIMTFLYTY